MSRAIHPSSRFSSAALGAWLACAIACGHAADERKTASPPQRADECSAPRLDESLRSQPSVAVILVLRDAGADGDPSQVQDRVLRELGDGFRVARRYGAIPSLAGELTLAGLSRARSHPDVRCIQPDGTGSGTQPLP